MKKTKLFLAILGASMLMNMTAFAGEWKQDTTGWWYQNDDGSFPSNTWQWIDDNNDGIAERYYFDENGYCLMNTTTPDGCSVNATGAWITEGVVQIQAVDVSTSAPAEPETQAISQETQTAEQSSTTSNTEHTVGDQVWLSATGSKYHRINNCGKMVPEKARQISTEEAINRGFEKCSKCY